MHELGIIVHVAKTLDEVAKENQLEEISSVTLEIGEVSGIVNDYLTDCWQYYKKRHALLKDSTLIIESLEALTYCEDCKQLYPTIEFGKTCPNCQSEHTYLYQGTECNIKEIEAK